LQAGVLEQTVAAMAVPGRQLLAWLGPAIGPAAFEVGGEVRESFLGAAGPGDRDSVAAAFQPADKRPGHYFADLYELARIRLRALGVEQIYGGGYCTCSDSTRFFSYRREGTTGRMASLILLTPN
jgi:copper oxidase (laccase) domain-containing protein